MNRPPATSIPNTIAPLGNWTRQAACSVFPELPWTNEPETITSADQASMSQICAACPVRGACQADAANAGVTAGYWAGTYASAPAQPAPGWGSDPVGIGWETRRVTRVRKGSRKRTTRTHEQGFLDLGITA